MNSLDMKIGCLFEESTEENEKYGQFLEAKLPYNLLCNSLID